MKVKKQGSSDSGSESESDLVSDILGFRDPPFRELQIIVF